MTDTLIERLNKLRAFLNGEAAFNGVWWGEVSGKAPYSWRKELPVMTEAAKTIATLTAERDALLQSLEDLDRLERQDLGAGISLQSWHKTEGAHNRLRDKLSSILMPSRSARIQAALKGKS